MKRKESLSRDEVVRALECCVDVNTNCERCPVYVDSENADCKLVLEAALELIRKAGA